MSPSLARLEDNARELGSIRCKECREYYGDESEGIMELIMELHTEMLGRAPVLQGCECGCEDD